MNRIEAVDAYVFKKKEPVIVAGREVSGMTFAENLERLDAILRRLEGEPLSLDEALEVFEEGVVRVKEGRAFLDRAEQRVTLLTKDGEAPFGGESLSAPSNGTGGEDALELREAPL